MKKYIVPSVIVLAVAFMAVPLFRASADTVGDLQAQIAQLIKLAQNLQTQIDAVSGSTGAVSSGGGEGNAPAASNTANSSSESSVPSSFCHTFSRNLGIGSNGDDVSALQYILQTNGLLSTSGDDKGTFGDYTASAVSGFQEQYASGILSPAGLAHGTGYVGALTRAKLNALYGCGNTSTTPPSINSLSSSYSSYVAGTNNASFSWSRTGNFSQANGYYFVYLKQTTAQILGSDSSVTYTPILFRVSSLAYPTFSVALPSDVAGRGGSALAPGTYYIELDYTDASGAPLASATSDAFQVVSSVTGNASYQTCPAGQTWNGSVCAASNAANSSPANAGAGSAVPSPNTSLSVALLSTHTDRAGAWNDFNSGVGNVNKSPDDWNWQATLTLPTAKSIKSMTLAHNTSGEVWTTSFSTDNEWNKVGYPLVIDYQNSQIDYGYDAPFLVNPFPAGTSVFTLYGQEESTSFTGGTLTVDFTDGTSVSAAVPASAANANAASSGASATGATGGNNQSFTAAAPTSSTQASVTILSPNGGEIWQIGSSHIISAQANLNDGVATTVRFRLLDSSGQTAMTMQSCGATTYNWTIPSTVAPGLYKISASTCDGWAGSGQASGSSNNYFTVTAPVASPVVSAALPDASSDKAGASGVFGPGSYAGNPYDWHIAASVNGGGRSIERMVLTQPGNEAWSTSNMGNWPLVIYQNGVQVNSAYIGNLSLPVPSSTTLDLYAQMLSKTWAGGTLITLFSDGTSVTTPVPASSQTAPAATSGTQEAQTTTLPPPASVTANQSTTVPQPVISSLSPSAAPAGTVVTIRGSGFSMAADKENLINFTLAGSASGVQFDAASPDGNTLTFTVPNYASGAYTVTVDTGVTPSNGAAFTLVPPAAVQGALPPAAVSTAPASPTQPAITSISPTSASGRTVITLTGSGFLPSAHVDFNQPTGPDIYASSVSADGTKLTFTIPTASTDVFVPGAAYTVSVTNLNGTPYSNAVYLTITAPSSSADSISVTGARVSSTDRAGYIGTFGPGSVYGNPTDWNWTVSLQIAGSRTAPVSVSSITVTDPSGETWATGNPSVFPLVVYQNGIQQNHAYYTTFGPYQPGQSVSLDLYGQQNLTRWSGGTAAVVLSDGTKLSAPIPAISTGASAAVSSSAAENSRVQVANVLSAIERILSSLQGSVK